ncbi:MULTISPECIES: DUF6509 family protein [Bacillaceae]|uniref:Pullulanase n=1 Tax=Peribacillus huizhouensis TaxID=1501239 RepID=A0ABR6CIG4_9BACI|nr:MULTISPECIES: DUF6509 family protein [Bacillaceae]MBA9024800.1 hypothetical protein [Peribacillus huizhouensis]
MVITEYSIEKLKDPFGILTGERYEVFLDITVPEDDELYTEAGIYIRILYKVEDHQTEMIKYDLLDRGSDKILDFELEDEEIKAVQAFCIEHLDEAL